MWLEVLYWIHHIWSSKDCVCVVPVIPKYVIMYVLPYVLFVFLYVGSYLLIRCLRTES